MTVPAAMRVPGPASTPLAACLAALALGLGACGDDEDGAASTSTAPSAIATETAPPSTEATEATETAPRAVEPGGGAGGGATAPPRSPESQPGGAGDEVPAMSQALIVGRGGSLHPSVVRVPPFIAVRVVLRSADGVEYRLGANGRTVAAGGEIRSAATTFDGLRAGERIVLQGPQGTVTVVANAEPGP